MKQAITILAVICAVLFAPSAWALTFNKPLLAYDNSWGYSEINTAAVAPTQVAYANNCNGGECVAEQIKAQFFFTCSSNGRILNGILSVDGTPPEFGVPSVVENLRFFDVEIPARMRGFTKWVVVQVDDDKGQVATLTISRDAHQGHVSPESKGYSFQSSAAHWLVKLIKKGKRSIVISLDFTADYFHLVFPLDGASQAIERLPCVQ